MASNNRACYVLLSLTSVTSDKEKQVVTLCESHHDMDQAARYLRRVEVPPRMTGFECAAKKHDHLAQFDHIALYYESYCYSYVSADAYFMVQNARKHVKTDTVNPIGN